MNGVLITLDIVGMVLMFFKKVNWKNKSIVPLKGFEIIFWEGRK
jgi:hypothetical protein